MTALFTNVPVDETIDIIVDVAFEDNWFNKTQKLDLTKTELKELLVIAGKNKLFQFEGNLYEQNDGVAMGSPLGPLMANAFMSRLEEHLNNFEEMPSLYKRYVDDTFAIMPDVQAAESFLTTLNKCHSSIKFTMEIANNNILPFLGMELEKSDCKLKTRVYKKPTDTGLLLHFQSHVDNKYKRALLVTMLNRAYRLSSDWQAFDVEVNRLANVFSHLNYPGSLIQSTIRTFVDKKVTKHSDQEQDEKKEKEIPIRIILPFKDQTSAQAVKKQLHDLSNKIRKEVLPVFTSRKIGEQVKSREPKPPIVNQQSVVYYFKCDLCDADYVGYTCRHLHQRIEEHKASAIGCHIKEQHGMQPESLHKQFKILRKCRGKTDCLIYEMLFIKDLKPKLNKQSDSIAAKLFT